MKNKTCCFTGHRPNKLFGYDLSNPNYQILAKKIKYVARVLIEQNGVDTFITGGALGVDTIAFFAVQSLKKDYPHIKNILAIPFIGQQNMWKSQIDLDRYDRMLKLADETVIVENIPQYKGYSFAQKLNNRNHYMVDNSNYMIAVHDGTKGGTYNCLEYAKQSKLQYCTIIKPK